MKKIKSLLLVLIALVLFGGVTNVNAAEKVKVYLFVAGGCPYCEYEKEYLQGLESYNEKFEIVEKQLYVDHIDWKPGKDYAVGKAVAEAFKSAGFEKAAYDSTPFVVISDLYAAAAYSENLEEVINEAYEKGDKDVVSCYANDKENCLKGADPSIKVDWSLVPNEDEEKKVEAVTTIILVLIIAGIIVLAVNNERKNKNAEKKEKVEEKPAVKKETKKTVNQKKKAPTKKTTNKK